jgi:hypothetical protein
MPSSSAIPGCFEFHCAQGAINCFLQKKAYSAVGCAVAAASSKPLWKNTRHWVAWVCGRVVARTANVILLFATIFANNSIRHFSHLINNLFEAL